MRQAAGRSDKSDAAAAVREVTHDWPDDLEPDILFVFCSTKQDPGAIARELKTRHPRALVVGCTTAGEHLDGVHSNGTVVVSALSTPRVRWVASRLEGLSAFEPAHAEAAVQRLFDGLEVDRETFDPSRYFGLMFVDGLRMKEEEVTAAIADALDGVALMGGSAGDDLAFAETQVILDGEAFTDGAVLVLAESQAPFRILKHQHFATTPRSLVVTKVDTAARRVYELDGYPAIDAYARALGLHREQITDEITFANPITFSVHGEIYVRSIQRVEPDGSLVFYCGVEEGMVVDIACHSEMEQALSEDLVALEGMQSDGCFLLACNCILRALEAGQSDLHDALGALVKQASTASIGFDTYGEQLNGLHINQTLVALALAA